MTYALKEQQKEAIRVLKYDYGFSAAEIIDNFAKEGYPITEAQVRSVSNVKMKNKSEDWDYCRTDLSVRGML